MGDGFYFFDPPSKRFQHIVDAEAHVNETRMNDGKTDRQGRFWSGTVFEVEGVASRPIGALYRLDRDLSCHRMVESIGCSNGLAWSPDSRTMYFTDSCTPYVWAWDFDHTTGQLQNRRVFIDLSPVNGAATVPQWTPKGATGSPCPLRVRSSAMTHAAASCRLSSCPPMHPLVVSLAARISALCTLRPQLCGARLCSLRINPWQVDSLPWMWA